MLTEAQKQELDALVASLQAQGKTEEEIRSAVDNKKAEMLGQNSLDEAKKIEPVTEIAAPAAGKSDMALQQEDGSLESPEISNEEFKKYNEEDLANIKAKFDQGEFRGEQREAYENYKQTKNLNPELLPAKKQLSDGWQLTKNAMATIGPNLANAWDGFWQSGVDFISRTAGKDAADWMLGEGDSSAIQLKDPETGKKITFNEDPEKWRELSNKIRSGEKIESSYSDSGEMVGEGVDQYMIDTFNKIADRQLKMPKTGSIVKGFKEGDIGETIGGLANVVSGLVTTMVPAIATRGASLLPQMTGTAYGDYNIQKAQELYADDPNAIEKLVKNNETEFAIPVASGVLQAGLEKFNLGKISKAIKGSSLPMKNIALSATAALSEGRTEYAQGIVDTYASALAKGKTADEAGKETWAWMQSEEALESFIGGLFGGYGMSAAGRAYKKLNANIRKHTGGTAAASMLPLGELRIKYAEATDPDVKAGIKAQITNLENEISEETKKVNYIANQVNEKDATKINTAAELAQELQVKLNTLTEKAKNNEITKEEQSLAREGYIQEFKKQRALIQDTVEKSINEAPKNVSKISFENAKAINEAYQKNPKSTEVFNNVVVPKMMPLVKKVSNKIFKDYKEFGEKGYTRQDFEVDLITGAGIENKASSLRGLYQSFRPEEGQKLTTYITNNLENRAKRILDEVVGKQVTSQAASLEAPQVRELTSDQKFDIAIAEDRIDTGKSIGLKLDDNKVKNIVAKHYNPDAKKFKSQIANDFKVAFKDPVDKFFGKDKVSDKQFSNKVTQNAAPLYDMLTVEGMRMARGVDGVNPFEEAGMLVFKDGKLEKVAFENTKVNALLDYLNDPNVPNNTRSNRKIRFKEAVAVSIASSQAIKALSTNADLQTKYKDLNQLKAEIADNIDKKGPLSKFIDVLKKIGSAEDINEAAALSGIKEKVTVNDNNRAEVQESVLNAIKKYGLTPNVFESAMPASSGAIRTKVGANNPDARKLAKFLEKNNKKAKDGTYYYALNNGDWVEAVRKTKADGTPSKEVGPPPGVDNLLASRGRLYYGKSDPKYIAALEAAQENLKGKTEIKPIPVTNNFFSKSQQERSKVNMNVLEDVANQLSNAVNSGMDPSIAALLISQGYQATAGLIKIAAQFKYKSKKFEYGLYSNKQKTGLKYREEHNPPASIIGANLIWAITNNKVKEIMPYIRKNYYQTQLSKKDDERLDIAKLDKKLPEGFSILDDSSVRLAKANIDLNTIVNMETGKTMAQELNVEGPSTPDAIKAANEVVTEDKIEFVIDRAIAKLTELTGTKGFAVDPFLLLAAKDVSLNVLVGGLRTVKATYKAGKSLAKAIDAGYQNVKKYMSEAEWLEFARVATQEIEDANTPARARLAVYNEAGVAAVQENVRKESEKILTDLGINTEGLTTDEINSRLDILRKARVAALNKKAPTKKARVFDFDDTLAQSKSNVLYLLPDGTTGTLSATEFAEQSGELAELGAQFDFSEFSAVKEGKKGPLAVLAKKLTEAKGDRDVFVLTARPAAAAESIQSFLRSALGISIPLENITGLGDGTPGAKAYWMAEKVSEGYNDMFFADDAPQNVAAVNKMLTDLGVKKKVQIAKEAEAPSLEDSMDNILRSKKPTTGSIFRKYNIYVPPGADDFAGLLYTFYGKGKLGESQMKFFQDNLMTPFAKGIQAYESAKITLARDYKELKKRYKNKKLLKEKVLDGLYTNEQAIRAYLYNGAGYDLGINKADTNDLLAVVASNPKLKAFADDLAKITKIPEGYPQITEDWLGGNIQTDLANASNKTQRRTFLTEFSNNKDQIFSDQNMQLIKQMHGNNFTDALKNVLERMETGINRKKGKDKEFNQAMNWINGSVANVMAVNIRSAVLQQLSIVNFMNWSHNNPLMMAKAMGNVPQFSKDFVELWNSTFLAERRGGLKIEINTADLADSNPGNFFLRTQKKLLELGFKPTQWGDSFAISFGGASWYRNRINQLIKQGQNELQAKEQAMLEFQEIAEESQQSSRPDKIARQQASEIGRFILAFANTPLQYARLTKKATLDLINGRGDWKTNASKIVYYGAAQNIIFSAIQSGLFSLLLSDNEDDEKEEKQINYFANGILDGFLRGMGYAGAAIASLKNLGMEYYDQRQRRERGERVYDPALGLIQAGASISPPISKKIGDIIEAQKFENWRQYKDDPFYQGFAYANYFSALANVPADRVFKKAENLKAIDYDKNEAWQNILLALGWSPYQLDVEQEFKKPVKKKKKKKGLGYTPLNKKDALEPGVLGKAHKDGTIQVKEGLSPAKKKEVIAHEKKHLADMKSGKLNYDNQNVYWKGKAYPRLQGKKIMYDGVAYMEGAKQLPWEKSANGIKV